MHIISAMRQAFTTPDLINLREDVHVELERGKCNAWLTFPRSVRIGPTCSYIRLFNFCFAIPVQKLMCISDSEAGAQVISTELDIWWQTQPSFCQFPGNPVQSQESKLSMAVAWHHRHL